MGLNGLLGSNDGFSSNFGGVAAAGVWMIVYLVVCLLFQCQFYKCLMPC